MSFVNVSIDWGPGVQEGGVGETCCMTFMCVLRLLPAPQNFFHPENEGITFKGFS